MHRYNASDYAQIQRFRLCIDTTRQISVQPPVTSGNYQLRFANSFCFRYEPSSLSRSNCWTLLLPLGWTKVCYTYAVRYLVDKIAMSVGKYLANFQIIFGKGYVTVWVLKTHSVSWFQIYSSLVEIKILWFLEYACSLRELAHEENLDTFI